MWDIFQGTENKNDATACMCPCTYSMCVWPCVYACVCMYMLYVYVCAHCMHVQVFLYASECTNVYSHCSCKPYMLVELFNHMTHIQSTENRTAGPTLIQPSNKACVWSIHMGRMLTHRLFRLCNRERKWGPPYHATKMAWPMTQTPLCCSYFQIHAVQKYIGLGT